MKTLALTVVAIAVLSAAWRWGSYVAGGSDSYCYVHQAERWADALAHPFAGRLQPVEPLALEAPWPGGPLSFTPIGHVPSPVTAGAIAPICPPGLSMLMAPFVLAGGRAAAFVVVPLSAVLLVLATYALGARYGAAIGVAAAAVTAASPVFLYQLLQPMSDVPAAAFWVAAIACATGTRPRHLVLAGLATSAAILVRPNLLPLGVVIGLFLLFRPERSWAQRMREAAVYAAWCIPGCLAAAYVQWTFHGSPLSSGYGSFSSLFATGNVVPNLRRYISWLWGSYTPAIALALAAPLVLPGALTATLAGLFVVNLALYLPYTVFEDWSFLRFLLPTLPLVVILAVASLDALWRRLRLPRRQVLLGVAAIAWAVVLAGEARQRQAFELRQMEARFEKAGRFVDQRLPANAIVFAAWQSGSVRFYSGRKTLAWHGLDPGWLDRSIAHLRGRGYQPYLLVERWEEPEFRTRFNSTPLGRLDWPPAYEIASQVRIYRFEDRQKFLDGVAESTQYVP
jgi:hypothetical protein